MPIYYDINEDGGRGGKNLTSFLVTIVLFYWLDLFVINITTSFHWHHLNDYTHYENICFNPRTQNSHVVFVTCINSILCVHYV